MGVLMLQGCASGVGKSVLVAGLCRILRDRGVPVAPFKAISIALNSGVSKEGLEMARAQILQAWAAGIEPEVAMNPVLVKPEGAGVAQMIIRGRVRGRIVAGQEDYRREAWAAIRSSLAELQQRYRAVIIEGSGGAAEPNLMRRDMANTRVARLARAPVLLVGDIERGGVFAALTGILAWLPAADRARIRGLVINRHHGPPETLKTAVAALERRVRKPVLGIVPHLRGLRLSEEDTLPSQAASPDGRIDIAIVRLPRISNFTDFEPLAAEPGARVRFCERPEDLGSPQAIILPGTKSTMADLEALRRTGFAEALQRAAAAGVLVFGICGGLQMLGERLDDPPGVEGGGSAAGLGLLGIRTRFLPVKTTTRVRGTALVRPGGVRVSGYEIHMGQTRRQPGVRAFARIRRSGRPVSDGAVARASPVMGTYLHGIFDEEVFRRWFLRRARGVRRRLAPPASYRAQQDADLDRVARSIERHLDLRTVARMMHLV